MGERQLQLAGRRHCHLPEHRVVVGVGGRVEIQWIADQLAADARLVDASGVLPFEPDDDVIRRLNRQD